MSSSKSISHKAPRIPLFYRLFYLYIEPPAAFAGAVCAYLQPEQYVILTNPASTEKLSVTTVVILQQLANLYLLFAINEALVLRVSNDLRLWRILLFGLLVADLGHLWSMRHLGTEQYWNVASWNAMAWGNFAFVYAGALSRICFLVGVGLS